METSSKCIQSLQNVDNAINVQQSGRILHDTFNKNDNDSIQCPTCTSKLKPDEMADHCEQEMQRLRQMKTQSLLMDTTTSQQHDTIIDEENTERKKPWSVFQRVQRNRQSRMKLRTRKRAAITEHSCPVCNKSFSNNDIHNHVEICLRRSNANISNGRRNSDEHSSNDDDDDNINGDEYEEYEWAGQKRIRVSSLLQGGYASLGIGQTITNNGVSGSSSHRNNNDDDEEEDLNVDEDDTEIYGPAQYGENDVIGPLTSYNDDYSDVTSYMRHLIANSTNQSNNIRSTNENISIEPEELEVNDSNTASTLNTTNNINEIESSGKLIVTNQATQSPYQQIIDSLKMKLRQYENHASGKYKCLICLDDYRNPAISVACWHVHCEQCWLRSLGIRKLCPQCNLITTPRDLRRIYM